VTMHHFSGLAAPFVRSKGTVSGGVFTRRKRYVACDELEHRNSIDASSFQVCTQNQIEAQRSGFDLERRSSGVSLL
ncbi:hypothetical protein AAAT94_10510, partial [Intestinimonas aquisgranensis]|nr:hypothetical protein [Intestinimonas aquisgranensis]